MVFGALTGALESFWRARGFVPSVSDSEHLWRFHCDRVCSGKRNVVAFLGTSRMAEVIDRHGADLVLHGHAHHGKPDGHTRGGVPVHNVAISLLQAQSPSRVYRIFDM